MHSKTSLQVALSERLKHYAKNQQYSHTHFLQAQEFVQDALSCAQENELGIDLSEVENLKNFIATKA